MKLTEAEMRMAFQIESTNLNATLNEIYMTWRYAPNPAKKETGGMDAYTTKLKTLKQPDEVNVFIDSYLRSLEKVEYGNEIYYYDQENDFTILQYKINNAGKSFVNTIYITYAEGRIES